MHKGGILLVTAGVLACTACLGSEGKLEVRASATGLKAGSEPVPYRIAEARGQLVLGNVAMALEGFRKAAREDPTSVDALAGIATCYDRIGRFDLSRHHYEMALALAPRDPALLAMFAGSLDRQGLAKQAQSVRQEAAAAATAPAIQAAQAGPVPAPAVVAAAAGMAPAPAAPEVASPVGQSVTIALPPPRPVAPARTAEAPRLAPRDAQAMAVAPVGHSVTIALPPPRPMATAKASQVAATRPPRLERLSLTEVALITGNGPRWKPVAPPLVMTAARTAPAKAYEVRLLNAARVDKLAARTRALLSRFGWREMAVGDAAAVRARSLIVYPKGTQAAARRLSARLGFAMAERADIRQVTILLGRDAARLPALRPQA
jgi:hypothetical protein